MQKLRRGTLFLLLLLLPPTVGCTRIVNRTAERKIRDVLPTYVGPAKEWRAHVDGEAANVLRGSLEKITLDGTGVRLRQTIVLDSLHIEMQDVQVDAGKQTLKSVGQTTFLATLGDTNLNGFLMRYRPPDKDALTVQYVDLVPGRLILHAKYRVLGYAIPFSIAAEPQISGNRLTFDPERMSVYDLRVPLPRAALRYLARYVETGFDFSTLPFPLKIVRFTVGERAVKIEGTADLIESLNRKIAGRLPAAPWESGRTAEGLGD